jgi:hypothetical protein
MANTVFLLNLNNTFEDWVSVTNNLAKENNDIAANNYIKPTGTLYLNDPTLGLQVANVAVIAGQLQVQGTGSSAYIQNNLRVDQQVYFTNTTLGLTNAGPSIFSGLITANSSNTGLLVSNNATINGFANINSVIANTVTSSVINVNTLNSLYVNAAFLHANTGFSKANAANILAQAAFYHANAGFVHANAAFDLANTKFDADGGTVDGTVSITGGLTVGGNFTINGVTITDSNTFTLRANTGTNDGQSSYFVINRISGMSPASMNAEIRWNDANSYWDLRDVNSPNTTTYNQIITTKHVDNSVLSTNTFNVATSFAANTILRYAQAGYNATNAAFIHANASYDYANTVNAYAHGAYAFANTTNVTITLYAANTERYAQSSYQHANSGFNHSNAAYLTANSAQSNTIITQGVDTWQNTRITAVDTYAASGYSQANAANQYAHSAYSQANATNNITFSAYTHANAAYVHANASFAAANNVFPQVQPAFAQANAATLLAQAAFNTANLSVGTNATQNTRLTAVETYSTSGYGQANVATNLAQAAFNSANASAAALQSVQLRAYKEYVNTATVTTATYALNLADSNIFNITLGASTTLSFTGAPTSGNLFSVTLILTQDVTGGRVVTLPTAKYSDGIAPALSIGANATDVLTYFTFDGGSTYFGAFAMANAY